MVNNILSYYKNFQKSGFEYFMNEWKEKDLLQGKQITLDQDSEKVEGLCKGVDDMGNLLLRLEDGSLRSFNYGDTSILKHSS
jgi:BirA family biotin operon repressor/biotin-[acetyl-CoA-carboxylase] ligase